MNDLDDAFARARAVLDAEEPPPAVWRAVGAAFDAAHAPPIAVEGADRWRPGAAHAPLTAVEAADRRRPGAAHAPLTAIEGADRRRPGACAGDDACAPAPPTAGRHRRWRRPVPRLRQADSERARPAVRGERRRRLVAFSGAAACGVVLALAAALMSRPAPRDDAAALARADDFVPLLPPAAWTDGPAWIVSAEISSDRLAALGLPYDPARAGERVRAELLLQGTGDVLAVRFVR